MIEYLYHDKFLKEAKKIAKKHPTFFEGLKDFERLCDIQFHPLMPKQIIAPAKLHLLKKTDILELRKAELILPHSGLRPNQFPRVWFAIQGAKIAFLGIGSHIDNYSDNEMTEIAIERVSDIF